MLRNERKPMAAPLLSIISTSYSAKRIPEVKDLLESILNQTYSNIEVIFVVDESPELAKFIEVFSEHEPQIGKVILNSSTLGVGTSRNIGIIHSHGEIVAVVDDDMVLDRNWATETVNCYSDPRVNAVTGATLPLWVDEDQSWFPKELYWALGCTVWDWPMRKEIRNVGGMNCSYRRDALFACGLYSDNLGPIKGGTRNKKSRWLYFGGEEVELCIRMRTVVGGKIIYEPKIIAYHKAKLEHITLISVAKRSFHFGYTKRYINNLYKDASDGDTLYLEHSHLLFILKNLPSRLFSNNRTRRIVARQILFIVISVFCTAFGYLSFVPRKWLALKYQARLSTISSMHHQTLESNGIA